MAAKSPILKRKELKDAEHRAAPRAAVIYEAIRQEGQEELQRSTSALIWSGLAAGLSMGFSYLAEALLQSRLPDTDWRTLITKSGYSVGFMIVILGRQQLFTENTLTPILQLLSRKNLKTLMQVLRLWSLVLLSNTAGTIIFALLAGYLNTLNPSLHTQLLALGQKLFVQSFLPQVVGGVFAGWLIALTVWLLPFAETARVGVIFILTYLVGLGGFGHIIAGMVSAFYVVFAGSATFFDFFFCFFIPVLLGNIIGGVSFVAIINYAQVAADGNLQG